MIENIPIIKSIIDSLVIIWKHTRRLFGGKEKPRSVQAEIPKKTIMVPPDNPIHMWWHMGSAAGNPAMQVVGQYKVTNITTYNILICAVKMKKPKLFGHVSVKDSKSLYHGFYEIPPMGITNLEFNFWITPPLNKEGETFRADVAVIDQFGNEHWIKRIDFAYR